MTKPTRARIYQPAKSAMQSGRGKTGIWLLEYDRPTPATPDALMGWNSMASTVTQVKLTFATQEEAVAYANTKNIDFMLTLPKKTSIPPKNYAENFSATRRKAFDASSSASSA